MKIYQQVDQLNKILGDLDGKTIVFTNGVFDLIHAGHIDILEYSKNQGDFLIVGINDDDSVKRLKGPARPIYTLAQRMRIMAALMMVDFVIPFSEDTPLELIKSLYRVDVLVKGGDYTLDDVVGREEVEKNGGRVLLFNFETSISTTKIIERIHPQK